jgi:hypothetical protein
LTGEVLTEPREVMTDEVYRWRWVDAANLLLPDDGPDPMAWRWIGEEIVVPLEEARQDPRIQPETRRMLRANHRPGPRPQLTKAGLTPMPGGSTGEDDEFIRMVEVYDLTTKRQIVWADSQVEDRFLIHDLIPEWIDNHPYAILRLGEPILAPEPSPWPYPVVADWLDPQDEYNIRRRQIMEGAKRSSRKVYYDEATFPDHEEAVKALQSPDDMAAVRISDVTRPPISLPDPDLPDAIYKDLPILALDWRIITGQTGARMTEADSETATEATFAERAANLRDTELQRRVLAWMSESGRKMIQCVKRTLTLDLWIALREMTDSEFATYVERSFGIPAAQQRLFAQQFPGVKEAFREQFGQQKWLGVTREQLQFEADVTVAPGSTRPQNLDVERQQSLMFLRIIGQFPQLALSRELLRWIGGKFEFVSERALDEMVILAERMVGIQSKVAGRDQGGANGAPTGGAQTQSMLASLMAGVRE